jgi:oxygen-independent coproporphyrinogen-3 oxidase
VSRWIIATAGKELTVRIIEVKSASDIREAISNNLRLDYVYSYPPRQSYRTFSDPQGVRLFVDESLSKEHTYNLYVHFPFCKQICGFCNLYATAANPSDSHRWYADWILTEVASIAGQLIGKRVHTVYFGGGTPSLLDPRVLKEVLDGCARLLGFDPSKVAEVALEVTPSSASPRQLTEIRAAGFNRINLGVQTTQPGEIRAIGRKDSPSVPMKAVETAVKVGFANVCVDLIYGLPGQSFETWTSSVRAVIGARPETICAYPLTLRPGTGFAKRGYRNVTVDTYAMYDGVNSLLQESGYVQETHVRWVLPGRGGYLQKQYHWACEALVGVGAGARSYLWEIDTRNGYSVTARREALAAYGRAIQAKRSPVVDGIVMNDDERLRKSIILGLGYIDRHRHVARFGSDPVEAFPREFGILEECGLVDVTLEAVQLTKRGLRYRDLAVQAFVSPDVRRLIEGFDYLH